ncbi:DUF4003 family protein [Lysinibacillus sp. KU-BSD001]|uniref:DUF4003 family protein n=1 Tax=Lysinibacillus sp. KU-BSD001 TaxID=3141328 RepID=UPI0036EFD614
MYTHFIQKLETNYDKVFNYTGGQPDLQIVISLAAQYTYAGRTYSGLEHQAIIDQLACNESINVFSTYGSDIRLQYKIAADLVLKGNVKEHLAQLNKNDRLLAECGFSRSLYRMVSAFFVKDVAHGMRAKKLYDEMNKYHPMLTRKSDFPFAILLTANNTESASAHAQTMNHYFKSLRERGFKLSDALQSLTQILMFFDVHEHKELVDYVAQLKIEFEHRGVQVKKIHYPFIGLLALTATDLQLVEEIVKLEQQLRSSRVTNGVKELGLIIAIQKLVFDYAEVQQAIHTTQMTSWADLLQFSDGLLYFSFHFIDGLTDLLDINLNF